MLHVHEHEHEHEHGERGGRKLVGYQSTIGIRSMYATLSVFSSPFQARVGYDLVLSAADKLGGYVTLLLVF